MSNQFKQLAPRPLYAYGAMSRVHVHYGPCCSFLSVLALLFAFCIRNLCPRSKARSVASMICLSVHMLGRLPDYIVALWDSAALFSFISHYLFVFSFLAFFPVSIWCWLCAFVELSLASLSPCLLPPSLVCLRFFDSFQRLCDIFGRLWWKCNHRRFWQ